jgi:hypothetical protein
MKPNNKKSVAITIDPQALRRLRDAAATVSESASALMTVVDDTTPPRRV